MLRARPRCTRMDSSMSGVLYCLILPDPHLWPAIPHKLDHQSFSNSLIHMYQPDKSDKNQFVIFFSGEDVVPAYQLYVWVFGPRSRRSGWSCPPRGPRSRTGSCQAPSRPTGILTDKFFASWTFIVHKHHGIKDFWCFTTYMASSFLAPFVVYLF